jgi:hypothetical protein
MKNAGRRGDSQYKGRRKRAGRKKEVKGRRKKKKSALSSFSLRYDRAVA